MRKREKVEKLITSLQYETDDLRSDVEAVKQMQEDLKGFVRQFADKFDDMYFKWERIFSSKAEAKKVYDDILGEIVDDFEDMIEDAIKDLESKQSDYKDTIKSNMDELKDLNDELNEIMEREREEAR